MDVQSHIRELALVTGASSGIGYELAICFAEEGSASGRHKATT